MTKRDIETHRISRQDFLRMLTVTGGAAVLVSCGVKPSPTTTAVPGGEVTETPTNPECVKVVRTTFIGPYSGSQLDRLAFPLGGIGAGMICLEGNGGLSQFSLRHRPDIYNEPIVFSALYVNGRNGSEARVLEGQVPSWKLFFPWGKTYFGAGSGAPGTSYGLPRFASAEFESQFPFGKVRLLEPKLPVSVELTGWSPFIPGDADNSSLPVLALEYTFTNTGVEALDAIYSFHAMNFMATFFDRRKSEPGKLDTSSVLATDNGFVLWQPLFLSRKPWEQGAFSAVIDEPEVRVNHLLFRGTWYDPLSMLWKSIAAGEMLENPVIDEFPPSPGGSLSVPFHLEPGETKTIIMRIAWHVPDSDINIINYSQYQPPVVGETYKPWYSGRFPDIQAVNAYWKSNFSELREKTRAFSECFYDNTLPPEVTEAIAANLSILKSPTILRQVDGRLYGFEGCMDDDGCCPGSTNHVWTYAQAIPHLFPDLERSLRYTELHENLDERGHQYIWASLPIRPTQHEFHIAADGQLGGVMKVYREWRISADTDWLTVMWPKVKLSLEYCIAELDPGHKGWVEEPHFNTYDIEFWGPDSMCTSYYLGALKSAQLMAEALEDVDGPFFEELYSKGREKMETDLWNGEYFYQKIEWENLRASDPTDEGRGHITYYSPEALELLKTEGPKYQYGIGCLSDGVVGAWVAAACGIGEILDQDKVTSHLLSVHKNNFRESLRDHANPQRPTYALGDEGGLLLCTWPKGGRPSLPFIYCDEVWTGIEYQVAAHLFMVGRIDEGLEIVRTARSRYDGRVRNPFDEFECGHFYARAMSSYSMLQGLSGARYDAVDRILYIKPSLKGDFRAFLCAATGYGTVGVKDGEPFLEVKHGSIPHDRIIYEEAR